MSHIPITVAELADGLQQALETIQRIAMMGDLDQDDFSFYQVKSREVSDTMDGLKAGTPEALSKARQLIEEILPPVQGP